ncbi:MAG: yvdP 1 [Anaerocolumna sp.]|nr:yvdP 1 [Anaerocolumna sp.]
MENFLDGLTGDIVLPFDPVYEKARQGYNSSIQQYPLIIVYCGDKCDVANGVIWAQSHKIAIRIRSGGHNYEGYSNGDCTLILDISRMNNMSLDMDRNILTVQAGVTNGQVYKYVTTYGYVFPGGTCPTVGVSGYFLGGGWGLSCRYLGLGCDSIEEIELINYMGCVTRANKTLNSDLFWALRGGGGGNYGIVTEVKFRLNLKVEMVTLIEIDYLHAKAEEQFEFFQIWQEWHNNADCRMTLISRIYNSITDGLAMLVRGIFYGTPEEAKVELKEFLELNGAEFNIEYITFIQAVTIIGSSYAPSEKFQSASSFAVEYLNNCEMADLIDIIQSRPEGSVFAGLSLYALGGRVSDIPADATAFYYRNGKYIMNLQTTWEENYYAKENREWVNSNYPRLMCTTSGSYVNFPYERLPNYLCEYYGTHVMRLKLIKEKYDPYNIFTFPQGINPIITPEIIINRAEGDTDGEITTIIPTSGEVLRGFRYVLSRNK